MENRSFGIKSVIALIVERFTNKAIENRAIVKVNSENLINIGDISMPCNLTAWRSFFQDELCHNKCTNIIEHYLHLHGDLGEKSDVEEYRRVREELELLSKNWPLEIAKCSLARERLCFFLNRPSTIRMVINVALENGSNFGQMPLKGETFGLSCQFDEESELTNVRLSFIQNFTSKLLRLQGYDVSNDGGTNRVVFTVKSHSGESNDKCQRYVCGVVQNRKNKVKDTILTWDEYMSDKVNKIEELNESRGRTEDLSKSITFLNNMAKAIVVFDMLAVKPTRPIAIDTMSSEKSMTIMKGALFVLYNTARIVSILRKYHEGELSGLYRRLPNIEDIDFTQLNQEEEWELVYNYILKYPELIQDCVIPKPKFHVSPQSMCLFLSRFSHKFSIYYRRTRILTEGCDHLLPKLFARLYMLKALLIVLQSSLSIFNVDSAERM